MKKQLALALLLAFAAALLLPGAALADGAETVRVAYIDYNNFVTRQEDGSYGGYGAAYLARIAQYTGWDYEFVEMDWPSAYEAVRTGDVDLYCVARQTAERQQDFDFSLYPVCNEEMNLYTLPGADVYYEDYAAFDGLRVGVLANSDERACFEDYAAEHGFACTVAEYPTNTAAAQALERGEVDAVALVKYSVEGDYKLVGSFGVAPAYMMSGDGSPRMEALSRAQQALYFDDPDFTQELEETYYGGLSAASGLLLTREEAEYIEAAPPLTVALSADMAPLEYYDESRGAFCGVSVDLLERISQLSGLEFRFVRGGDGLQEQLADGSVQLLGALAGQETQAVRTVSFAESSFSLITKDHSALTADSVAAVPAGQPLFAAAALANGHTQLREYHTADDCVRAVSRGEADLCYAITMCGGYLLDHIRYSELQTLVADGTDFELSFGVAAGGDGQRLLSILNKCLAAIPDREVSEQIALNTAEATPPLTLADWEKTPRCWWLWSPFWRRGRPTF